MTVKIEYRRLNDSDILYRCYVFHRNPTCWEEHTYIYMNTNRTYKPTYEGEIYIGYISDLSLEKLLEPYLSPIRVSDLVKRTEKILLHAEHMVQIDEKMPNAELVLVDLAEAYMQMYNDIQKEIPMHIIPE